MGYKVIQDRFWIDPDTKYLKPMEKYFILHLKSHPHAHYSGIYHATKQGMAEYTGLSLEEIEGLINTLSIPYRYPIDRVSGTFHAANGENGKIFAKGFFVLYDDIYEIVFIADMLTDQTEGNLSQNQLKGVAKHLKGLPKTHLINKHLDYYKAYDIKKFCPELYPIPDNSESGHSSRNNNSSSSSKNNSSNSEEEKEPAAVSFKIPEELKEPLKDNINKLSHLLPSFNCFQFIGLALNKGIPIEDSTKVLISMAKKAESGEKIVKPWGYITNALKNINEAYIISESVEQHEQLKEEERQFVKDLFK